MMLETTPTASEARMNAMHITSSQVNWCEVREEICIGAITSEKNYTFNTKNDLAVARAYGFEEILDSEPLIVAELMKRYESLTKK